MFTIAIILFLFLGIYTGARRGLVVQVLHLIGYLCFSVIALWRYQPLSRFIEMYIPYPSFVPGNHLVLFTDGEALSMDTAFYYLLSFLVVMGIGWGVVRIVTTIIKEMTRLPIVKQFNTLGGAIFGFIFHYVTVVFILYLLSMIPLEFIQKLFEGSELARMIVTNTPLISKLIMKWLIVS